MVNLSAVDVLHPFSVHAGKLYLWTASLLLYLFRFRSGTVCLPHQLVPLGLVDYLDGPFQGTAVIGYGTDYGLQDSHVFKYSKFYGLPEGRGFFLINCRKMFVLTVVYGHGEAVYRDTGTMHIRARTFIILLWSLLITTMGNAHARLWRLPAGL